MPLSTCVVELAWALSGLIKAESETPVFGPHGSRQSEARNAAMDRYLTALEAYVDARVAAVVIGSRDQYTG